MSYGFSLGVDSASGHFDDHSELIHGVTDSESVVYCLLPGGPIKKFVHRFTIDQDRATIIQVKAHSCYSSLTLARTVIICLSCGSLYQVEFVLRPLHFRYRVADNLGSVRVIRTIIDLEPAQHLTAIVILRQHSLYGQF